MDNARNDRFKAAGEIYFGHGTWMQRVRHSASRVVCYLPVEDGPHGDTAVRRAVDPGTQDSPGWERRDTWTKRQGRGTGAGTVSVEAEEYFEGTPSGNLPKMPFKGMAEPLRKMLGPSVILAACLNGLVMIVYSALLIVLNRKVLPDAIKVKGFRLGMLFLAVAFYGFFGGWYILDRIQFLLSGG